MNNQGDRSFYLPYNPKLVARAKVMRQNMTSAEKKLWYEYLRGFQFRVLRQRPIDQFIVDFYCPKLRLVIEIDGESHSTEESQVYDLERTQRLQRIWSDGYQIYKSAGFSLF